MRGGGRERERREEREGKRRDRIVSFSVCRFDMCHMWVENISSNLLLEKGN